MNKLFRNSEYNGNNFNAGGTQNFNEDITGWNVSNVTDMSEMFLSCSNSFNQDLSGWDVGNVTNMNQMFYNAPRFNSNISFFKFFQ